MTTIKQTRRATASMAKGFGAKFTPGPWKVAPNGSIVTDDMKCSIATPAGANIDDLGNAHLIAAAPDLLAALKSLLMASATNLAPNVGACAIRDSRAAIAKARGLA